MSTLLPVAVLNAVVVVAPAGSNPIVGGYRGTAYA